MPCFPDLRSFYASHSKVCSVRLFILLLSLASVTTGCKKDVGSGQGDRETGDSVFYIRFKADGIETEYTSNAITQVLPASVVGLHSCVLQGYKDFAETDRALLSLIIWSEDPITMKTYRNSANAVNTNNVAIPEALVTYLDNSKLSYLSHGVPASLAPPLDRIVSDVTVTITVINETRIAGSFSGTVYKTTDGTFSTTVKLSEGSFILKRL